MLRLAVVCACLAATAALCAADTAPARESATPSRFYDAEDGWFDLSEFLDTTYEFVPVVMPITEPAVGYGAVGALVFIDRKVSGEGQPYVRPNIAAVGGFGGDRVPNGVGYSVSARGGVAGGNYRIGDSPFWTGLRYVLAGLDDIPIRVPPGKIHIVPGRPDRLEAG